MGHWSRLVSAVGGERIVAGLGGLYVVLATARAGFVVTTSRPFAAAVIDFVLVGGPGIVLLYGGFQLPRSDLDPDTYPRIVAWCLGGFVVALGLIELVNLEPGVDIAYPRWSFTLGAAVGTAVGFGIGANDARAITHSNELARRNEELQRQNGRLDSFARMVAHELRNPLAIGQIYSRRAADGDPEAAEEVLTALDRIEEMVEVILVTARGSDATIDTEPVALPDVAEDTWAELDAERAELVVETDRTVLADPIHLRHLLENLFENAVEHGSTSARSDAHENSVEHGSTSSRPEADDAAEHGGATRQSRADDAERNAPAVAIRVGSLPGGFYVEDDGPGIPEAERDAVLEAGHTTDEDGIGLGLTFVSQLADTYGWDCEVTESESGGGERTDGSRASPDESSGGARFEFQNVDLAATERRQVQ